MGVLLNMFSGYLERVTGLRVHKWRSGVVGGGCEGVGREGGGGGRSSHAGAWTGATLAARRVRGVKETMGWFGGRRERRELGQNERILGEWEGEFKDKRTRQSLDSI